MWCVFLGMSDISSQHLQVFVNLSDKDIIAGCWGQGANKTSHPGESEGEFEVEKRLGVCTHQLLCDLDPLHVSSHSGKNNGYLRMDLVCY